ncbi:MAG TPA: M67 family metallopeptidase [Candidatus Angelobacter sp.]|nr:M67 family metallopeptidase [Candidatus Angelobacter sp.]
MTAGAVTRLLLPRAIVDELMAHARRALPHEACGLLGGSIPEGLATTFHAARNEHASPLRYSVDPEDLVRIVLGIEETGQELVAVFHSHVGSAAIPSASDLREARYPDALHLIASMADAAAPPASALRAWRIVDGRATEVPIELG